MRDTQPIAAGARGLDAFGISMNRRIAILVILAATLSPLVFAQSSRQRGGGFSTGYNPPINSKFDPEAHAKKERFLEQLAFRATDPYRVIDGRVEWVMREPGWRHFFGHIGAMSSNRIEVSGWFGAPMQFDGKKSLFVVTNYPYIPNSREIPENAYVMAKMVGMEAIRPRLTVPILDYGRIWTAEYSAKEPRPTGMTNLVATIVFTVTTNWQTVSYTYPKTDPTQAVYLPVMANQSGTIYTNRVLQFSFEGKTNAVVVSQSENPTKLSRSVDANGLLPQ